MVSTDFDSGVGGKVMASAAWWTSTSATGLGSGVVVGFGDVLGDGLGGGLRPWWRGAVKVKFTGRGVCV